MALSVKSLQLRPMTRKDLPFAMRLHNMERWNQLEPDWEFLIDADTGGNFVAVYDGHDAGTVTTFTYQNRFSWIGMVLVDREYRGLGIGNALLNASIEFGKTKGTLRLDATPQGEKLYKTLGFKTERILARYELNSLKHLPASGKTCKSVSPGQLNEIAELDSAAFGAERRSVLNYLLNTNPQYAWYLEREGKITGYCFGRPGVDFHQIGPITAENENDAKDLLLAAIQNCPSPVIVDVFDEHSEWIAELKSLGFEFQRPFIRMYLGELRNGGNIKIQYAIAGPEIG